MKKKARTLEKQGEKLDKPIDKYMAKAQAYLDKNAANLDMKMSKAKEKYANSIKAAKEYYSESARIGSRGNDLYSIGDVNAAKVDWQLANEKLAAGQSIENRANKKLEKTEKSITKKRKKYATLEHSVVIKTYGVSENELYHLGVIDNVSTAIGGGGAAAANAFTNNLNTQNQALVSNLSNPNNVQMLNAMLSNTATNANQLATSFDPSMVASMESLYSNPQYAQALAYANQIKMR